MPDAVRVAVGLKPWNPKNICNPSRPARAPPSARDRLCRYRPLSNPTARSVSHELKNVTAFEKHFEKILIGVTLALLGAVFYFYVLNGTTIRIDGQDVQPSRSMQGSTKKPSTSTTSSIRPTCPPNSKSSPSRST